MFYSLPTEFVPDQSRFIRTEDLAEGIQSFTFIDEDPESDPPVEYPYCIAVRMFLQTVDKEETVHLWFKTATMRLHALGIMMRDLWNMDQTESEPSNAVDRRKVVRQP